MQTESSYTTEAYFERSGGIFDFCGQPCWQKEMKALHSPLDSCACRMSSWLSGKTSDVKPTTCTANSSTLSRGVDALTILDKLNLAQLWNERQVVSLDVEVDASDEFVRGMNLANATRWCSPEARICSKTIPSPNQLASADTVVAYDGRNLATHLSDVKSCHEGLLIGQPWENYLFAIDSNRSDMIRLLRYIDYLGTL
ncbi:hypothetical protein MRX96_045073 [Rhipicephalus microplus]